MTERGKVKNPEYSICRDQPTSRASPLRVNTLLCGEGRIRATAVQHGLPCITTIQAAEAAVSALEALRNEEMQVEALQDRWATELAGAK